MSYRGHFMNEHSRFDRMVALSKSDQTQRKQQQQLSITGTQQKPESDVHENNNNTIDFNFPVAPYDVQLQLMHALYKAIDDRSVGLFESPTGTGKTLSIICATLTWLRRNRVSTLSSSLSSSLPSTNNGSSPGTVDTKGDGDGKCDNDDDDPPWVAEQTANRHATLARDVLRNRARAYNARVRAIKAPALRGAVGMDVRSAGMRGKELDEIDDLFGDLGDGSSDDGFGGGAYRGHGRRISTGSDVFRKKTQYGNARRFRRPHSQGFAAGEGGNLTLNGGAGARDTDKTGNQVRTCRIIFATRTHSQISQFVQEMRRTSFFSSLSSSSSSTTNNDYCSAAHPNATTSNPNSTTMNGGSDDIMFKLKLPGGTGVTEDDEPPITVFSFGSRKHMCVNDSVLALKSSSAIAERCQELTTSTTNSKTLDDDDVGSMSTINPNTSTSNQKRKRAAKSCAFHDADHEARVRDTLLAHTTPDIEDAVRIGRAVGGCPYYATRQAVADGDADVIMVPYAGVLHAADRKSVV